MTDIIHVDKAVLFICNLVLRWYGISETFYDDLKKNIVEHYVELMTKKPGTLSSQIVWMYDVENESVRLHTNIQNANG